MPLQFQPGDALHIAARGLAGQHGLQGFGIFARSGQQQLTLHAPLLQQLQAARALRGQVDEGW